MQNVYIFSRLFSISGEFHEFTGPEKSKHEFQKFSGPREN